jgi:hypothetical protein
MPRAAMLALTCVLLGCATSRTDVDMALDAWRNRVATEIPVGTDVTTVVQWFERQGMQPQPNPLKPVNDRDLEVYLGSVPAREWFCGRWMLRAVVRVSPEKKVERYDFDALGDCL